MIGFHVGDRWSLKCFAFALPWCTCLGVSHLAEAVSTVLVDTSPAVLHDADEEDKIAVSTAHAQVEESASVTKGAAEDDIEPRDVNLGPESHTVYTDTKLNENINPLLHCTVL